MPYTKDQIDELQRQVESHPASELMKGFRSGGASILDAIRLLTGLPAADLEKGKKGGEGAPVPGGDAPPAPPAAPAPEGGAPGSKEPAPAPEGGDGKDDEDKGGDEGDDESSFRDMQFSTPAELDVDYDVTDFCRDLDEKVNILGGAQQRLHKAVDAVVDTNRKLLDTNRELLDTNRRLALENVQLRDGLATFMGAQLQQGATLAKALDELLELRDLKKGVEDLRLAVLDQPGDVARFPRPAPKPAPTGNGRYIGGTEQLHLRALAKGLQDGLVSQGMIDNHRRTGRFVEDETQNVAIVDRLTAVVPRVA